MNKRNFLRGLLGLFTLLLLLAAPAQAQIVMGNVTQPGNVVVNPNAPGQVISQANYYAGYLTGTAYTLTGSVATVTGGTTSPTVTLAAPGTYVIFGNFVLNSVGATFAANQTCTFSLYRSNNTPATVASSSTVVTLPIMTTLTATQEAGSSNAVIYTTANSGDVLVLQAGLSATPSAGSMTIVGGGIYALRLY